MNQKKLVASVLVGNTMEFYDFIVFAFMSKYISALFFPNADIVLSYISTFAVFATGYLMRPIGGLFFGYIGDKYGRKVSLSYSVLIITVSTFLIGLLPTYQNVGILAAVLLTLCRLLQGFSVSGEQSGAAVYLSEMDGSNKAYSGSLVLGSAYFGVLLGSATCLVLSLIFTGDQVSAFAWRIPFFLSVLLGVPSLIMRRNLIETQSVRPKEIFVNPVVELFMTSPIFMIIDIIMVASLSIPIYMFTLFLPSYLTVSLKMSTTTAQIISVVSLLFLSVGVPLLGRMADKFGITKIYSFGCLYNIVLSYPIFLLIATANYLLVCLGVFLLGFGLLFVAGTMFAILIAKYKSHVRYTAVSFIFNTSMSIFGSLTPLAGFYLIARTNSLLSPWMLLFASGIAGLTCLRLDNSKEKLQKRRDADDKNISIANIA